MTAPRRPDAQPWPVVLVHGTRTSHSQWDRQLPALRAAGHRVLTPDLPGHGSRRERPFTLIEAVTTIRAAVGAAAAGSPVHLVGSSLGGMLAIRAAALLGDEAERPLGSLTVCGGAVQPTPAAARAYGRLIRLTDLLPGTADGRFFRLLLGADGARAYLRGGRAEVDVVAPAMAAVASLDLLADLRRIQVPVTFLHGRFDQLRIQERAFAQAAARGRLELLPYGTHLVNLTLPSRFNAELLRVLARAEREG
ncbi:alpha/beta fold hydrolase [Brachybacterium sp. UNK5269]|uniref:alpha/beta fold hydrolase n=1 Tax=Brachybacterium sp. UNK5269 TaxID=3408576 RepID=UPI003BAF6538